MYNQTHDSQLTTCLDQNHVMSHPNTRKFTISSLSKIRQIKQNKYFFLDLNLLKTTTLLRLKVSLLKESQIRMQSSLQQLNSLLNCKGYILRVYIIKILISRKLHRLLFLYIIKNFQNINKIELTSYILLFKSKAYNLQLSQLL